MDIDNLSDSEVVTLIKEIKHFLDHPVFAFPQTGKYKKSEIVQDKINGIEYKLVIYRGNLENKYSMHIRFSENDIHLVRLCINGSTHTNKSDGTTVGKNHIHIYKNEEPVRKDYAYDLEKYNFVKTDDLANSFDKFIQFVSIDK